MLWPPSPLRPGLARHARDPPGMMPPGPLGSAGRPPRICSSCTRAAICCATSAAWMPWNSPSSQPTSWACATRSSRLARRRVLAERQRQPLQLVAQLGRQAVLQLDDRPLVDLPEPVAAGLVERRRADLLQQLLDHAADPHDLGRLLDQAGRVLALGAGLGLDRADRPAVRADHHHGAGAAVSGPLFSSGVRAASVMPPSSRSARPRSHPPATPGYRPRMAVESRDVLTRPAPPPDHTVRVRPAPGPGRRPARGPRRRRPGRWSWSCTAVSGAPSTTGRTPARSPPLSPQLGYPVAQLEYRRTGRAGRRLAGHLDDVDRRRRLPGCAGAALRGRPAWRRSCRALRRRSPRALVRGHAATAGPGRASRWRRSPTSPRRTAWIWTAARWPRCSAAAPDEQGRTPLPTRRADPWLPSVIVHGDADRYVPDRSQSSATPPRSRRRRRIVPGRAAAGRAFRPDRPGNRRRGPR